MVRSFRGSYFPLDLKLPRSVYRKAEAAWNCKSAMT